MIPRERLTGQNRGGEGARTGALPPCPVLSTEFFICFQYDCRDHCTSELSCLSSAVLLRIGLLFIGLVSRCSVEA